MRSELHDGLMIYKRWAESATKKPSLPWPLGFVCPTCGIRTAKTLSGFSQNRLCSGWHGGAAGNLAASQPKVPSWAQVTFCAEFHMFSTCLWEEPLSSLLSYCPKPCINLIIAKLNVCEVCVCVQWRTGECSCLVLSVNGIWSASSRTNIKWLVKSEWALFLFLRNYDIIN